MNIFRPFLGGWLICLTLIACAPAQEWTRFRGPNGSGVSAAKTVPVRWTEADYNWKVKLPGVGHSSPVLWGERIFVTSGDEENGARIVECRHTTDGRVLWSKQFRAAKHAKHELNSFASATPAVDEHRVYVSWATPHEYIVLGLDHTGREVWRVDLGSFQAGHGFGASPIVWAGLVVVPNDQNGDSSLVALDSETGKIRWKVPRQSKASYTTPCVYQLQGGPAQLIFTCWEHGITSIDPATGRTNWEQDVFSKGHMETAIGSPIVAGDLVLATCGWLGVKKEVVAVRPSQRDGEPDVEQVYRIDRSAPLCTTPLVKEDLLFLWSDEGVVTCADVRTGEVFWRERARGTYYSSPVCVGDYLYSVSAEGDVVVLAASKQYRELARVPLGEGSYSTPAVAGGRMYLRTFSHLMSIGRE